MAVALSSDPPLLLPAANHPYPPCCVPLLQAAAADGGSALPDFWSGIAAKLAAQQNARKGVVIEHKSVANRNPVKGLNEDRIGVWRDDNGDGDDSRYLTPRSKSCLQPHPRHSGAWCMAVCDGHGGSDCAE
jgi:hypothetical protein